MSGKPSCTIHGDLITETTINRVVKVRGGPKQGRYSTSEQTTDTFIKTSHIMAKLRATLKERLDILTSSTHKEINIGARRQHDNMVQGLVRQLDKDFDPFLIGSARHMKTGVEKDHNIVSGLLSSMEEGSFREFVDQRLKADKTTSTLLTRLLEGHEGPKGCDDNMYFFDKIARRPRRTQRL